MYLFYQKFKVDISQSAILRSALDYSRTSIKQPPLKLKENKVCKFVVNRESLSVATDTLKIVKSIKRFDVFIILPVVLDSLFSHCCCCCFCCFILRLHPVFQPQPLSKVVKTLHLFGVIFRFSNVYQSFTPSPISMLLTCAHDIELVKQQL